MIFAKSILTCWQFSLTPTEPSNELLPLFRKVVKYYLVDFAGVSKHWRGSWFLDLLENRQLLRPVDSWDQLNFGWDNFYKKSTLLTGQLFNSWKGLQCHIGQVGWHLNVNSECVSIGYVYFACWHVFLTLRGIKEGENRVGGQKKSWLLRSKNTGWGGKRNPGLEGKEIQSFAETGLSGVVPKW